MKPSRSTSTQAQVTPEDALKGYREQFLDQLKNRRYKPNTLVRYGHAIDALVRQMLLAKVALSELDEKRAVELMIQSEFRSHHDGGHIYTVKKFVKFLLALGVTKPGSNIWMSLKREYEEYLRVQRGLSERTIYHCWRHADRFLTFRFPEQALNLTQITSLDIVRYLQNRTTRGKQLRDKTTTTHLRNFFLFLFRTGRTVANLALSIPRVAQRYGARLPRSLTQQQVEQLLDAVRADSPVGRRNYAMMLLLARLGLRAPEVVAIQIDDIDWRKGELVIRGKGQRQDRLPLPEDVGAALAEYIRRDRVTDSRALFVTDRAPQRPFSNGQILNLILRSAYQSTGLKPPVPYVGSHILRHTLAVSMIRRGATLAEIGELLRHRSAQSTAIYARLDVDGLASITHPWPTTGGAS